MATVCSFVIELKIRYLLCLILFGYYIIILYAKTEQLDGSSSINDESDENDTYAATIHQWKVGILGTVFLSFLDVTNVIEESDLSDKSKDVEKAKVLEARKQAFGSDFVHFPPWRKK